MMILDPSLRPQNSVPVMLHKMPLCLRFDKPVRLQRSRKASESWDYVSGARKDEHLPTDVPSRSWPAALTCCAVDAHARHGRGFLASLACETHASLPWAQQ